MWTSTLNDDDDASVTDDRKARRIHAVLEQIRSKDAADERRSVLEELHSFANTLSSLELPPAPDTTSSYQQDKREHSYSDRLAQTRGDLKLLEQLVSQTFHWLPQQSSVHDSVRLDVERTRQQHAQVVLDSLLQHHLERRTPIYRTSIDATLRVASDRRNITNHP